jgi:signal transduction histidine kinase
MDRVADFIRSNETRIAELWEDEVRREEPALRSMSRPVLLDHLPEFLDGLANYIEGDTEKADRAFSNLVEGHALQRLGYGVGLETLTREYSKVRLVILRAISDLSCEPDLRDSILRMHEGMDRAMNEAIHRYAGRREEVRERFISILGHDLRDPLSTIKISANILAANPGGRVAHRSRMQPHAADDQRRPRLRPRAPRQRHPGEPDAQRHGRDLPRRRRRAERCEPAAVDRRRDAW